MTFTRLSKVVLLIVLAVILVACLYLLTRRPAAEQGDSLRRTGLPSTTTPIATPLKRVSTAQPAQEMGRPSTLAISNVRSAASVSLYDQYEVRFEVTGTVATNLQWPYDPGPVSGMASDSLKVGITVDGLFLPPGQSDWAEAIIQPAFLFQPTIVDRETVAGTSNSEWIYPQGEAYWLVRFAPKQTGDWQFRIRAQDDTTYPGWSESGVSHFMVQEARPGNHGFVQVSSRDPRYFEYSDGTPYTGTGVNASDGGIYYSEQQAEEEFREKYAAGKLNLGRAWMDMELIFSRGTHAWDAWRSAAGTSDELRTTEQVYLDHDFSIKLARPAQFIFQASNGNQRLAGGLEAGKTYVVRVTAYLGETPAANLEVRLLSEPANFDGIAQKLGPDGEWVITDLGNGWKRYESQFTNTQGRLLFKEAAALAVGVTDGTAYLDEVYIGEELGGGKAGPNVVFKGKLNYHQYFDPIASADWDWIFQHAEDYGLALKVVISDKQDLILDHIRLEDGVFDPGPGLSPDNFYSQRGAKARRLQEYFWRYLAARWGYTRGVHSWELLNEGDPGSAAHRDQAIHLAQVMKSLDPNHLATTSFWSGFPAAFWVEAKQEGAGYADVHAYLSSGAAISPATTDDLRLESDSAAYHLAYSRAAREALTAAGGNMPIVRGEAGIDTLDQQREQAELAKDEYGVWLHTFVWAMLDPGGMYELYWWSDNLRNQPGPDGDPSNGLFEIFAAYNEFMADIPLNAGGYVEAAASATADVEVVGQQNQQGIQSDRAHLWIRQAGYTWKHVVEGVEYGSLAGTVTIAGMAPDQDFHVEWWDFNAHGDLRVRDETVTSDASGLLRLKLAIPAINGLPVTDTAVKIGT